MDICLQVGSIANRQWKPTLESRQGNWPSWLSENDTTLVLELKDDDVHAPNTGESVSRPAQFSQCLLQGIRAYFFLRPQDKSRDRTAKRRSETKHLTPR